MPQAMRLVAPMCRSSLRALAINERHTIMYARYKNFSPHREPTTQTRYVSQAVLAPPSRSYKPITSAPRDHGNISHDPTRDSSRDPFATCTSCDLSARDPGNLRPCDPGKITHDLSRNWSSTMSHDKTRFGHASKLLINTWQIMGTINKMRPLNNQRTHNATQSTKTRLIRARP